MSVNIPFGSIFTVARTNGSPLTFDTSVVRIPQNTKVTCEFTDKSATFEFVDIDGNRPNRIVVHPRFVHWIWNTPSGAVTACAFQHGEVNWVYPVEVNGVSTLFHITRYDDHTVYRRGNNGPVMVDDDSERATAAYARSFVSGNNAIHMTAVGDVGDYSDILSSFPIPPRYVDQPNFPGVTGLRIERDRDTAPVARRLPRRRGGRRGSFCRCASDFFSPCACD